MTLRSVLKTLSRRILPKQMRRLVSSMNRKKSTTILYCFFDTTVQIQLAILLVGDGQTCIDTSKTYITKYYVISALGIRRFLRTSMSCLRYKSCGSTRNSVMTILGLLIKVASKVIQNVDSVESGFMAMTSCTLIAETNMRSVISAIGEIMGENSNTMSTTTL